MSIDFVRVRRACNPFLIGCGSWRRAARQRTDHLLQDLLFDDAGHPMVATHANKAGVRYRYYVSRPALHGEAQFHGLGTVTRVPAPDIEQAVLAAVRQHGAKPTSPRDAQSHSEFDREALAARVSRIEVHDDHLMLQMRSDDLSPEPGPIAIPWQKPPFKRFRQLLLPPGTRRESVLPERAERRARLVAAIARGR